MRDESAQVIVGELNSWIFTGYDFQQMQALKTWVDQLRDHASAFLHETCDQIAALGPPSYTPDYMISRGMMPRKNDDDWQTENFDTDAAWYKALHEINPCPK